MSHIVCETLYIPENGVLLNPDLSCLSSVDCTQIMLPNVGAYQNYTETDFLNLNNLDTISQTLRRNSTEAWACDIGGAPKIRFCPGETLTRNNYLPDGAKTAPGSQTATQPVIWLG